MVKTENLTDKELINFCKHNPKIIRVMSLSDEFIQVAKEIKKLMDIPEDRLKVIENYWNKGNKLINK